MPKPAGIYVHIPFCEQKCTYCNFNTTDFNERLAVRYVGAVAQEISYWGRRLAEDTAGLEANSSEAAPRAGVDTIYFGGGTPSIVEAELLAMLIEACRSHFAVSSDAEITIEINPGTLSRKKLEGWLDSGINRASVGVQSFIDRELVALSRTHTAADARRTIDALREAGFTNISLDLIAGLPEQTISDWEINLAQALEARPEHMSLYLLEVKEGTQLFGQIKRGLRPSPDDDLAAEMYQKICRATRAAGYDHYEISNFALYPDKRRPAFGPSALSHSPYRSKHNMKYWTDASFYGMGCGAHSYDGRSRWVNVLKTESYVAAVSSSGHATAQHHDLSEAERLGDALFMGLRLIEGISLEEFYSDYGVDILERYADEISRLTEAGLLEVDGRRLRLTEAGLPLSNEVFVAFV